MTWWRRYGLALLFLLVGLANLVRAGVGWYEVPVLVDWPLSLPLPLLIGAYAIWGLVFTAMAAIWWWRRDGPALPVAVAYQLFLWIVHLTAYRASYARRLWPRDLVLSAFFLVLVAFLAEWRMKNRE